MYPRNPSLPLVLFRVNITLSVWKYSRCHVNVLFFLCKFIEVIFSFLFFHHPALLFLPVGVCVIHLYRWWCVVFWHTHIFNIYAHTLTQNCLIYRVWQKNVFLFFLKSSDEMLKLKTHQTNITIPWPSCPTNTYKHAHLPHISGLNPTKNQLLSYNALCNVNMSCTCLCSTFILFLWSDLYMVQDSFIKWFPFVIFLLYFSHSIQPRGASVVHWLNAVG